MRKLLTAAIVFLIFCGCKKEKKEEIRPPESEMAGFEVVCDGCSIYYSTQSGHEITVDNVRTGFTQKYEPQQYFYVQVSRASSFSFKLIMNEKVVFRSDYDSGNAFGYDGKTKIFSDGYETMSFGNTKACSHNGRALLTNSEGCFYYKDDRKTRVFVDKTECACQGL